MRRAARWKGDDEPHGLRRKRMLLTGSRRDRQQRCQQHAGDGSRISRHPRSQCKTARQLACERKSRAAFGPQYTAYNCASGNVSGLCMPQEEHGDELEFDRARSGPRRQGLRDTPAPTKKSSARSATRRIPATRSTGRSPISRSRRRTRRGASNSPRDFYLLKPVEMPPKANGRLLLDSPNRGRKVAIVCLQQHAARTGPSEPRALRQRLPDAPRLHRRVGRLAAGRAAHRRDDGARRAARRTASRAGCAASAGRTSAPHAPPRRPLPHPLIRPSDLDDPRGADHPARACGSHRSWKSPETTRHFSERRARHAERAVSRRARSTNSSTARSIHRSSASVSSRCATAHAFLRWARRASPATRARATLERAYLFGLSQSGRFLRHML